MSSCFKLLFTYGDSEEYEDDKSSRFVNERMNGNIQHDGTFSVIPRMYGGVTTADDLMKIAEVAKSTMFHL